ncbi:hypothetical protein E2562_009570 [Oryza meyeriana var. granulata]|uniref:4-hydroxy-7-methoxy-3-oxo-3,4-dihydro-2H-1,4-benzoxazin-2-yl glucosidebeta-D-glucosidase n=1 Tax=Oryza meyeriana var. granulata TaxID=110450 RepID=A0A6G1F606_9ORYZ|nr:hypothetical protein E2562_009570 [Oryza meyeriana var. granulata]
MCFREFGDRVKHWTTMDEPNLLSIAAYNSGTFPPCRCSPPFGIINCTAGNSTVEPYVVAHNSILAHASALNLYRDKYHATQKGVVCINVYSFWNYPYSPSSADIAATQRSSLRTIRYLSSYMGSTLAALRNGTNVKGYFVWSFLDVFELLAGYHSPYGLHHVDFEDPSLPRQPKLSAHWYSKFLRSEIGINIDSIIGPDAHEHPDD